MMRAVIILIIMSCSAAFSLAQSPEEQFANAGELYSSGDFSGAAAIYRKLYDEGYRSEKLFYNAGNAFFKAGDNASAILFYERARLTSPADEDINYNLQLARSRVNDKFETLPELFFVRWVDFISLMADTNTWAVASLLFFVTSLIFILLFLIKSRAGGRLLSFWLALSAMVLSSLMISLSIRSNALVNHNKRAVVTCSIVTGRSAPGEAGNELFVIHSGTTVTVEDILGEYSEIRLPDGNKGWIKYDCIEKI
jgi:tetratricopeptide (TPR) repeat protein